MNLLDISAVIPSPLVFHDGTDPATGTVVHHTVYSGYVVLTRSSGFRGMVRADDLQPVSFFVPESARHAQLPDAVGVELSVRRFRSTANSSMSHFGAVAGQVTAEVNPPDGERGRLVLSFQAPIFGHDQVEINYRVTVPSAGAG